ncbi:MAG TPA: PIN domain-containing protein [Candidatus Nanoarchaeia archaeon]|nr:PIN domain-containing protein [Candidatus Nanoarchaeia archaeon]
MVRYYIDTSIWRDLHENRVDRFRPLGEWAFELIRRIRINKEKIIYSDLTLKELNMGFEFIMERIFNSASYPYIIERVEIEEAQIKEAKRLRRELNIPFNDCLHAIIARDNGAIMVTRDNHFQELQGIADIKKPEDLI